MTWRGVAGRLRAMGYRRVATPAASAWDVAQPVYIALAKRIAAQLGAGPWVLVGHSGAGGLLPAIAEAVGGNPPALIFADAILPHAGKPWLDTAPPGLVERLRTTAKEGQAPRWPDWFGAPALERLLPDDALRTAFVAETKPIASAFFTEPAPLSPLPASPCAYLQLSDGYQTEADAASQLGWKLAREPSHHLAMITEPDKVAAALHRLLESLSLPSGTKP
jgi:hypothetical protein